MPKIGSKKNSPELFFKQNKIYLISFNKIIEMNINKIKLINFRKIYMHKFFINNIFI